MDYNYYLQLFLYHILNLVLKAAIVLVKYIEKVKNYVISNFSPGDIKPLAVQKLAKVPNHLGFLINDIQDFTLTKSKKLEETLDIGRISRALAWSFSMGIQYVSLYDPQGILKGHEEAIRNAVASVSKTLNSSIEDKKLLILSAVDGGKVIMNTIGHMINNKNNEDNKNNNGGVDNSINDNVININNTLSAVSKVRKIIGESIPEVDLLLMVGRSPVISGFMPFCLRLAEILKIPPTLTWTNLITSLQTYANIQQRCGR